MWFSMLLEERLDEFERPVRARPIKFIFREFTS
jgi:hypothetical protein